MEIKNIRIRPPGHQKIVHPETNADIVQETQDKKIFTREEREELQKVRRQLDGEEESGLLASAHDYTDESILGVDGILVGGSAYESAVHHGYEGSEEEWLKHIQGKPARIKMDTKTWEIYDVMLEDYIDTGVHVVGEEGVFAAIQAVGETVEGMEERLQYMIHQFDTELDMIVTESLKPGDRCMTFGTEEIEEASGRVFRVVATSEEVPESAPISYMLDNGYFAYQFSELSGGGGGTGTGTGPINEAVLTVENTTGWIHKEVSLGSDVIISFNWSSIESGLNTGNGEVSVSVGGVHKYRRSIEQGAVSLNISSFLADDRNSIQVTVSDIYGNRRLLMFNVVVLNLYLRSSFNKTIIRDSDFPIPFIAYGEVDKTVRLIIDGEERGSMSVPTSGRERVFDVPALSHGSHLIEIYFTTELEEDTLYSNSLFFDVIATEPRKTETIISSPFVDEVVSQYSTVNIPYRVYTPDSLNTQIELVVNNEVQTVLTVGRSEQYWQYRAIDYGSYLLEIRAGDVSKSFAFEVEEGEKVAQAETEGLLLHLSSEGRSNFESDPSIWKNGNISALLTDFTWTADGWQRDQNGEVALRLMGDARVFIPFNFFANNPQISGKTLELEFGTRDTVNYDTPIIQSIHNGIGLNITAQRSHISSEQSSIMTQHKEDEIIRLSFVIEKQADHRLLKCYINGIMSRAIQYPRTDNFSQIVPQGILIGSNECTVDLYTIRAYGNDLTQYQILENWIADTRSIDKLIDRHSRNDIFDAYGKVSISKLPPDLPYLVFEGAALPQYKGDKKTIGGYFIDPLDSNRNFTFSGASIDVQGTSSQYYARKNYKIVFSNGFVVNGVPQEKYPVSENSLPTDTFTFKADVASSEGVNNVGLVDIYEKASPYKTPPQISNPKVRQGIDGFPMVVFFDDGTGADFIGKYNFNNDEGDADIFGFRPGDEAWEIENNNTDRVLFKSDDFSDDEWHKDFDPRYPKGNTSLALLQPFVSWVVSTDRNQATNAALDSPYEQAGVTYTHDTPEYRLAKFRKEAASVMKLESALYFYLFTEIFLMVDSRAKNSFPTIYQEDGKWCFIPYDMDTALGINNEGELVFGYDLEDTDFLPGTEDTPVYNGQESVLWNNIRDAFPEEIKQMYTDLRAAGYISYDYVHNYFTEHQSKWSEAIFNEDGKFKYLDPLTIEGSSAYLGMLQGSKAEQRKWWLYNRLHYLDSKFNTGQARIDVITLRGYAKDDITITPYADIYASILYGQYLRQVRATRGNSYTLPNPLDTVADTEIYIYSASQLAEVGDLSGLRVGFAEFKYATKLQHLKLGDASPSYSNPNLIELGMGQNTLLKTLDVRNCPNLKTAVDLSGCYGLEKIYFQGTGITGLELPAGGALEEVYLPGTIRSLSLVNKTKLNTLEVESYSNLTTLRIENTPSVDILRILAESNNLARVRLVGIDEDFGTASQLMKLVNLGGLDENGTPTAQSIVTGKVYIATLTQQELDILSGTFPELEIEYSAIRTDFTITFVNWDGTILDVQKMVYGEYAVDPVTRSHSPIDIPTKPDDGEFNYAFVGWEDFQFLQVDATIMAQFAKNIVYAKFYNWDNTLLDTQSLQRGIEAPVNPIFREENPISVPVRPEDAHFRYIYTGWDKELGILMQDTDFYATYENIRQYTVTFKDWNGSVLKTEKVDVGANATPPSPPSRPDSGNTKYAFIGWDGSYRNVQQHITITAQYEATNYYIVTFRNWDETVLNQQVVEAGHDAVDPILEGIIGTPMKDDGSGVVYTYHGWDSGFSNVTKDITIYPVYFMGIPEEWYVLAQNTDFEWMTTFPFHWKYIGSDDYVIIPHVIQERPVTSYYQMFRETSVKGVKSDNKNITSMVSMFSSSQATTLDLSSFDTSNVTNMSDMFYNSQATTLDLSSFDTSNVTNMSRMFYNSQATTLDLSSFDTSNVTTMASMFRDSQATTLDLSSFDTSNVTNMSDMFNSSQATTLDLSSFDTSNVTTMASMFRDSKATTLDLSSFDTSNVTNMSYMFYNSQATTLDLSSFDTSNVTTMASMFNSSQVTALDLSNFDTSNVTNMSDMFYNSKATTLDLSSFDTSNVTNMSRMFYSTKATTGYARTQADADKFNSSDGKPSGLNFIVKPEGA